MHLLTNSCDKKPGLWTWSLREEISAWISQRLWGWAHHLSQACADTTTHSDDPTGSLPPPPLHWKAFSDSQVTELATCATQLTVALWCSVLRSPYSPAVASQSRRAAWTLPWAPSPQCYPGTSRTKVFTSLNNNNFKQPVSARVTPSIFGLFFCSIVFTTFFINYTRL